VHGRVPIGGAVHALNPSDEFYRRGVPYLTKPLRLDKVQTLVRELLPPVAG
jgi:hypothetical protein